MAGDTENYQPAASDTSNRLQAIWLALNFTCLSIATVCISVAALARDAGEAADSAGAGSRPQLPGSAALSRGDAGAARLRAAAPGQILLQGSFSRLQNFDKTLDSKTPAALGHRRFYGSSHAPCRRS